MRKVWIELTQPHEHEGATEPPGKRLELFTDQASWLIGLGKAVAAPDDDGFEEGAALAAGLDDEQSPRPRARRSKAR
ncbi:DUF7210 family protein [Chitinimonas koreensis]|uniref:DUF7210 family protein n=1 Tax=Chitinimonas koreensis TaxID=356302 RepID=UPI000401E6F0|nr:hypothetical protein [Chitinimonas koreensis]QNM94901.1 hypothetical protein H9L41_13315 [Chitinimonas koreensis]